MIDNIKYRRLENVTHEWTEGEISEISLPPGYEVPVLIAAMQTFNGDNTAEVRMRSLLERSFEAKIEEETSADPEVSHLPETVGHIAFAPTWIRDTDDNVIGYATYLDIDQPNAHSWTILPVPWIFSVDDSVVFAQVLSFNGNQPVHPRIRKDDPSTGDPGFFLKLEEWPTYDQLHVLESVGIVVLKKGFHALRFGEDPHLMVGEVTGDHTWQEVDLGNTIGSGRPVLVTQCQTYNGPDSVVTRQRESNTLTAEVRLQEAESQGWHTLESVGYVAMGIPLY